MHRSENNKQTSLLACYFLIDRILCTNRFEFICLKRNEQRAEREMSSDNEDFELNYGLDDEYAKSFGKSNELDSDKG